MCTASSVEQSEKSAVFYAQKLEASSGEGSTDDKRSVSLRRAANEVFMLVMVLKSNYPTARRTGRFQPPG